MAGKSNIYAFFGNDEAQVKEAALRLSQKIAPQDDEFGLEIVSGGADNSDHAVQIVGQTIEASRPSLSSAVKKSFGSREPIFSATTRPENRKPPSVPSRT